MDPEAQQRVIDRVKQIPIVSSLGFRFVEWGDGTCKLSMTRDKRYDGIYESLHGGLLMTLADSAACFAIMSRSGPDEVLTTTDMNIRFLAPCLTDPVATARVIKFGKTLCPVTIDIHDQAGVHVAVAQVTYMRLDRMPARKDQ